MRILLVTDGMHPFKLGGMQKHSYQLTKQLANNNTKVNLVYTSNIYDL